jgi:hypothetical protein
MWEWCENDVIPGDFQVHEGQGENGVIKAVRMIRVVRWSGFQSGLMGNKVRAKSVFCCQLLVEQPGSQMESGGLLRVKAYGGKGEEW